MSNIHWARMTWQEIREAQKRNPVVLIPIGTIETQGPYNIVGLETIIVERLAEEVAKRTDSLVLPVIPFGYSDSFMEIPGTICIRPEILEGLYEDVFRAVLKHGFDHLLFLAEHVPNQPILKRVFRKMRAEKGILAASLNPGRIAPNYVKDVFERPTEVRGHGAEPGLSLAEYLCPEDVSREGAKPSQALKEFRGLKLEGMSIKFEDFDVLMAINMEDIAPATCGYGDPTQGGPEQGKIIFERMVDAVTAFVEEFKQMDTWLKKA
jgi:creatinine amidohydrolase